MKLCRLTTCLYLGLVLAAVAPASGQGEVPVTGTLLDEDGRPLAGAEVTLHPTGSFAERGALLTAGEAYPEPTTRAATRGDGRFRIAAPGAGFWTLVARADGRVPLERPLWPLTAPAELEPATLLPDAGVRVRVVDEADRPVSGAVVGAGSSGPVDGIYHRGWPVSWRPVSDRLGLTDEAGRLRLPRFEGEELVLRAVAPGRSARLEVGEPPAEGAVRIVLAPGPTRRLRVVGLDGRPVAGAVVWFASSIPAGLTGEDGTLDVPLAAESPEEPMEIQVDSPDGLVGEAELGPPPEGDEPPGPVTVRLERPPVLSGRAVEEGSREGVAGALVWLVSESAAGATADRTGSFRIAVRRPSDREAVLASAPGYLDAWSRVPPKGRRGPEEVVLVLAPAVDLRGVVVDAAGQAVPGAEVRVSRSDLRGSGGRDSGRFARSGRDGRFRVRDLAPDAVHLVEVTGRGYSPTLEEVPPAPAAPGSAAPEPLPEVRVVLHAARGVRGRVVSQAGEPVAGAQVRVLAEERVPRRRPGNPPGLAEGATGADGTFELEAVPAGPSTLQLAAPGYAPLRESLEVPQGGGVTDVGELVLEPEAFVVGRVVDPEGAPVAGASVRAWSTGGSPRRRMFFPNPATDAEPVTSGEDGGFRVGGAAAGDTLRLEVRKEGYVEASVGGVLAPTEEPLAVVLRPAATVAGTVVDERGRPVPDAEVRPSWRAMAGSMGGGRFRPVQAGDRGAFELSGLAPGRMAVEAAAPGYQLSAPLTLELAPGERREGVEIVLAEGVAVTGRVLGPDGLPMAGAKVGARAPEAFGATWRGSSVETGADGGFTLDTLAPGRVVIEASREGFAPATEELDVGPGGASVELYLGRGAEVSGRVLEADGSPAGGRTLQLTVGFMTFDNRSEKVTAADGSFVYRGVGDGEYRLRVIEDFSPVWSSPEPLVIEGGASVTGLEIRLPDTTALTGRLVGLEPGELRGASVHALVAERSLHAERAGHVLEDGSYRVGGLIPGRWQVIAAARSGRQARGFVEVEAGQRQAALDLEFRPGHTVTGTVLSGGEPVAGAQVNLGGFSFGGPGEATTGLDGRFRLEGIAAGRQTLTVRDPHAGAMTVEELQVDGDRDVHVELEANRVRGTVYAADGSGPIAGAEVQLQRVQDEEPRRFFMPSRAISGEDGSFLLTGLAAGRWRLLVEKAGYAAHASDVEVLGGDVEAAPVFLERGGSLEVTARMAGGGTPSFLMATILGPGDEIVGSTRATPVEPGRFVLTTVPSGSWELALWVPEAPRVRVSVEAPGTAEVVFPEPCALEVAVPALAAEDAPGYITVTDATGRSPWVGFGPPRVPLVQGRGELPNLAPGTYVVTVTADDGRTWTGTATVTPARPTQLVLE